MPTKRLNPRAHLIHIRDNVILANHFVADLDYDGFCDNHLVLYAVTRALEVISERLPDEVTARHPERIKPEPFATEMRSTLVLPA